MARYNLLNTLGNDVITPLKRFTFEHMFKGVFLGEVIVNDIKESNQLNVKIIKTYSNCTLHVNSRYTFNVGLLTILE